ncbi:hypothetical protein GCM10007418_16300 [Halopseudomonas salina]|uniref:Uncharacterized protein n=1 Tax=Halopseudomonas salina TaxID=1323744 RepID=A0ABQ1PHZ0_9GAMM|nr:hypothetical protein GCM10007418_16300 [Halopseudomonas salina]
MVEALVIRHIHTVLAGKRQLKEIIRFAQRKSIPIMAIIDGDALLSALAINGAGKPVKASSDIHHTSLARP